MENQTKVIKISGSIGVGELADALGLSVTRLIGELFKNGIVATINQRLDFETASIVIEELGFTDVKLERKDAAAGAVKHKHELSDAAAPRPPIVAIMGHVDHGKTTLLDTLLDKKTAAGEAGGITQHISAYQVEHNERLLTFLDTPGHAAFAALRQHSAELTDIVVLVVAADDGVKPQTVEAIKFAESANAKIIVAINKIDKSGADVNRVMAQLATEYNLNPEEWGGNTVMVPISAKTGENLDKLLDLILLTADIEELRADVDIPAEGLVIESHVETGKGSVVNLLVENGVLKLGNFVVAGKTYGKIRTMLDFAGKPKGKAEPSTPVTVTGFKDLPSFGDEFAMVPDEKTAKRLVALNSMEAANVAASTNVTGSDLLRMMKSQDEGKRFNVIIKADVIGSVQSVVDSLKMIDTGGEVEITVVGSGVGNISENDIRLAASGSPDGLGSAIIYGFNVELPASIKNLAQRDHVEVRIFRVIYDLLNDAKAAMEELLPPKTTEVETGEMVLRGVFRVTKDTAIVGGEVLSGQIKPLTLAKLVRGGEELAEVEVASLQKAKVEAKELVAGEVGGLSIKTSQKIGFEIGDRLKFFTRTVEKRKL